MFENLSERLEKSFKLLKGQGRISEINIAETLRKYAGRYLMLM
jgi:signal recognition particle subunit SRP54